MNSKPVFKRTVLAAGLALLLGCGNYSNEDLDFQLALPEQSELEVKMPQALSVGNAAEYYVSTRNVVIAVNSVAAALVGLVDNVRGYTPTSRNGNQRVWGPFPEDKHPDWQMRVLMSREDEGARFSYRFQLRLAGQAGADFVDLMTGWYAATGGARRGTGQLVLDTTALRTLGYPVDDDFEDLALLTLDYSTAAYPFTIRMTATKVVTAGGNQTTYDYAQNEDGSGTLTFVMPLEQAVLDSNELSMTSRWLGSGAGRADASLTRGERAIGTDCWGIDSVATYRWRLWSSAAENLGSADTCLIP